MIMHIVVLLFVLIGQAQAGVLYEQTQVGHAYDITEDAGGGYSGLYSDFPFWSGSGPIFPGSGGLVLPSDIRTLRLKPISGVPCTQRINLLLASDDGSNVFQGEVSGVQVDDYCDYTISEPTAGKRFWSIFICINNRCDSSTGTLVLDGSPDNPGYLIDGTQTISQRGGWAFQLCDINGCSDFANKRQKLLWPLPDKYKYNISQGYAEYGDGSTYRHHTAFDIGTGGATDIEVRASAGGRVIRHELNNTDQNNTHCMGNVIIIDHGGFSTLYAHLADGSLTDKDQVEAGEVIGTVGGTGGKDAAGNSCSFPIHLHFEVKEKPYLATESDDEKHTWGYAPEKGTVGQKNATDQPDAFGYYDPALFLHNGISELSSVTVTASMKVNTLPTLRMGPDKTYTEIGSRVEPGNEYVAIRELNAPTVDCSGGWYQITNKDQSYFDDNRDYEIGSLPKMWVCRGNAEEKWVSLSIQSMTGVGTPSVNAIIAGKDGMPGTGGTVSANATGTSGSQWVFTYAQLTQPALTNTPPNGYIFPFDFFDFTLSNGPTGGQAKVIITYPEVLPYGTVYWKYGPTPDNHVPHWYIFPASISGNTITLNITDGGLGDDDLIQNGVIVDQGGPAYTNNTKAIPTLTQSAIFALMLMLLWPAQRKLSPKRSSKHLSAA